MRPHKFSLPDDLPVQGFIIAQTTTETQMVYISTCVQSVLTLTNEDQLLDLEEHTGVTFFPESVFMVVLKVILVTFLIIIIIQKSF